MIKNKCFLALIAKIVVTVKGVLIVLHAMILRNVYFVNYKDAQYVIGWDVTNVWLIVKWTNVKKNVVLLNVLLIAHHVCFKFVKDITEKTLVQK